MWRTGFVSEAAEFGDDLTVVHRRCVRLIVRDTDGSVLLFATRDPTYPELGTWWELPGGGRETGETLVDAAVRELWEETGLTIGSDQIGPPLWTRTATFKIHGKRHVQAEKVMVVSLGSWQPPLNLDNRQGYEVEDYFDHRWWSVHEIVTSRTRFYPGRLASILPAVLADCEVREPFEHWS